MKTIFEILRGVVIGLANIIPGVSGGTMMVSMGIYDTIIGCINSLFKDFKRCVKTLWPYALGMVLGILGLAKLITFLLGTYPQILRGCHSERKTAGLQPAGSTGCPLLRPSGKTGKQHYQQMRVGL